MKKYQYVYQSSKFIINLLFIALTYNVLIYF